MVCSSRGTSRGPARCESGRVVGSRSVSMSGKDRAGAPLPTGDGRCGTRAASCRPTAAKRDRPTPSGRALNNGGVSTIYVTGHRNPDTDSIASAIGYAELKRRLDPRQRLRAGAPRRRQRADALGARAQRRRGARVPAPRHAARARRDARELPVGQPPRAVRDVGLAMAREDLDLMPIVDDDGALAGVMTERTLARRYIRESREADEPRRRRRRRCAAIVEVTRGRAGGRRGARDRPGACGCWPWTSSRCRATIGDGRRRRGRRPRRRPAARDRARRRAAGHEQRHGARPTRCSRSPASTARPSSARRWTATSPSRMVTLSAPCRALMDAEPLTVRPDDLLSRRRRADQRDVDYRAAVAVDGRRRPVGLVTRAELVDPEPRRVLLVDHAEQAQSVPGVEQAEIVEILDHHHIGSIETKVPVHGDLRPGRLDRHAGRRALPPERHGADAARRRRCCSGRCCRTP